MTARGRALVRVYNNIFSYHGMVSICVDVGSCRCRKTVFLHLQRPHGTDSVDAKGNLRQKSIIVFEVFETQRMVASAEYLDDVYDDVLGLLPGGQLLRTDPQLTLHCSLRVVEDALMRALRVDFSFLLYSYTNAVQALHLPRQPT